MRKRLITPIPQTARPDDEGWLDLDRAAVVEVTSENKDYPVESALLSGETRGWRAASPGTQTIRLLFDQPQRLRRISLVFEESEIKRTQEFVLRWSPDGGRSFREIAALQNIRLQGPSFPFRAIIPAHAFVLGHNARTIRDPGGDRCGWHGGGIPRPRHPAGAHSSHQSAACGVLSSPRSAKAARARSPHTLQSFSLTSAPSTTLAIKTASIFSSWSTSRAKPWNSGCHEVCPGPSKSLSSPSKSPTHWTRPTAKGSSIAT